MSDPTPYRLSYDEANHTIDGRVLADEVPMSLSNQHSDTPDGEFEHMPKPPNGYATCRVHDGEQKLLALGARRQVTHLVALDEVGSNGGRPTVCGLTRFDKRNEQYEVVRPADLPGWSMGGGVYGPGVKQARCWACFDLASTAALSVSSTHPTPPGGAQ